MSNTNEIYKCTICGAVTEVIYGGRGELTCCGKNMLLLRPNTEDASEEKHVPVIEKVVDGIKVKVGSVPHPMDDDHYIAVIELASKDDVYRKTLKPGNAPEAVFNVNAAFDDLVAKEYCTLHGLWQA